MHGADQIFIKGARVHNLQDIHVRLPRNSLVVLTGVSGSGKSSLAFDTLYAEGHRKYMESLSTRARQAVEQMPRPDLDYIQGLSPVVAIEQRGGGSSPRSTVATVTEILDYARLLWCLAGEQFCPKDGGRIVRRTLDENVTHLLAGFTGRRMLLLAPWIKARSSVLRDEVVHLRQRGFQRIRIDGKIRRIDEPNLVPGGRQEIPVDLVIDRLQLEQDQRSRLSDSLELAFREGRDRAMVLVEEGPDQWREVPISRNLACSLCGEVYETLTPRHFSFNTSEGACPDCGGLGKELTFVEELLVPDPAKSVRQGAIKALRIGGKNLIIRHNALLKQLSAQLPFDPEIPWKELGPEVREIILQGDPERQFAFRLRGRKKEAETSRFRGVVGLLEEAIKQSRSDGYRARLSAFQSSGTCRTCGGNRLHPRSAGVEVAGMGMARFLSLAVSDARQFIEERLAELGRNLPPARELVEGLRSRTRFLADVGLGYLTLDREYSTLSGGEAQRVRLATQLGMGLTGVIYVLDEPSIGLHPRDNQALIRILLELRDRGNTVVVVEHDEDTIRAADHLLELGPGAGRQGGRIVYEGRPETCAADENRTSLTGGYLSRKLTVEKSGATLSPDGRWLRILGARAHNLRNLDTAFPVGLLTCVTGVSGSGKSTLVNDILARSALRRLNRAKLIPEAHASSSGWEFFDKAVLVDQDPIGQSPRSNPATYTKIFDLLREVFAKCPLSKVRGYTPSRFSFNVRGGRCENCQGEGYIKMDMLFLSDAYIECPSCHGKRYNRETLEVRFAGHTIADILALTVEEARTLFRNHGKLLEKLDLLRAVGLGYLQLGQPANTLSGGEAQRLKLALELARRQQGRSLYILDEPTTGLHWADIQKLLDVLIQLRDAGNTIILIEHHLDLIHASDWIIDLGPGGGHEGGELVYTGSPNGFMDTMVDTATARVYRDWVHRSTDTTFVPSTA